MDFYTLKTRVDIEKKRDVFERVLSLIGYITQPLIIGEPVKEGKSFLFRFAVRETTFDGQEEHFIDLLVAEDIGFKNKNTEIVKATRL